jgi:hypothetical protein
MITLGSWRKKPRSALSNVTPARGLTPTCVTPATRISTGSSTEHTLFVAASRSASDAYSVVLLPLPVGPVTTMKPHGERSSPRYVASMTPDMPSAVMSLVWV